MTTTPPDRAALRGLPSVERVLVSKPGPGPQLVDSHLF